MVVCPPVEFRAPGTYPLSLSGAQTAAVVAVMMVLRLKIANTATEATDQCQ